MTQKRAAGLLLAACLLPLVSACSLLSTGDRPKPAPLAGFKATASAAAVWRASVGASRLAALSPAVLDGAVYAASESGALSRIDGRTGRIVWRVQAPNPLTGGVGAGEGRVLVGTTKGELVAYDTQGKPLWNVALSSQVRGAPQAARGLVVARTMDGRVYGLDAATGRKVWGYERAAPALILDHAAGLLVTRGAVFAGFPGGRLVALHEDDGQVGWEANVAMPKGATEIERVTDVTAAAVMYHNQVCAVAYQGRVSCFDALSGNLLWGREASSAAGLATDGRNLYVPESDGQVRAFDLESGAHGWVQPALRNREPSAPAMVGGLVAVGDVQGYVHFLSPEDGSVRARMATDGSPIAATPQLLDGDLVVQTRDGQVARIHVR